MALSSARAQVSGLTPQASGLKSQVSSPGHRACCTEPEPPATGHRPPATSHNSRARRPTTSFRALRLPGSPAPRLPSIRSAPSRLSGRHPHLTSPDRWACHPMPGVHALDRASITQHAGRMTMDQGGRVPDREKLPALKGRGAMPRRRCPVAVGVSCGRSAMHLPLSCRQASFSLAPSLPVSQSPESPESPSLPVPRSPEATPFWRECLAGTSRALLGCLSPLPSPFLLSLSLPLPLPFPFPLSFALALSISLSFSWALLGPLPSLPLPLLPHGVALRLWRFSSRSPAHRHLSIPRVSLEKAGIW